MAEGREKLLVRKLIHTIKDTSLLQTYECKMELGQMLPVRLYLDINGISKLDHVEATVGEMNFKCGFI
jgi:hypothetical protein